MGQLIIFEGLDGSGKGTQTKLTARRLQEQGKDLRQVTFPNYESDSSALVKMYLSGAFGDKPDDVNAYAASSFYAVDRYASYKTDWGEFYREGGLVLSDRYTTSNAVHQCSKLPPMHWDGFLNWLFDFESPSATTATRRRKISRRRTPSTWPAAAPPPSTAPARWAGTALNAPSRQTAQNPCALSRISTPRYLRN